MRSNVLVMVSAGLPRMLAICSMRNPATYLLVLRAEIWMRAGDQHSKLIVVVVGFEEVFDVVGE